MRFAEPFAGINSRLDRATAGIDPKKLAKVLRAIAQPDEEDG